MISVSNDYSLVGALNTLHWFGYNVHERQLLMSEKRKETFTFSRRKHSNSVLCCETNAISDSFISSENQSSGSFKQFAIFMLNRDDGSRSILAPGSGHSSSTHKTIVNTQCDRWLEEHGFMTREEEYEELFKKYFDSEGSVVTFGIFSKTRRRR